MVQLFLLPFAGGNVTSFVKLTSLLSDKIEPITIEYSGRGNRLKDGYIIEHKEFLLDVVNQIKSQRDKNIPYALLGYSMGSTFVYEIASGCLLDSEPIHLFYCASPCIKDEKLKLMTDEEFITYTEALGGFDSRSFKNRRLFNLFMHPLLDDYNMACKYKFSEGQQIVCNTTVFYSNEDTSYARVKGWANLTSGETDFYEFGNNHFFLNQNYSEMAEIINSKLK